MLIPIFSSRYQVDSLESFISDIHNGRWDSVLAQASSLQLPKEKMIALYEQVILEMIELREIELSREVILLHTHP